MAEVSSIAAPKIQKVMVQPINILFRFLQNNSRVSIWLYETRNKRIEGVVRGFDEFMNVVLSDADEVNTRTKWRRKVGTILLRGENITLMQNVDP